MAEIILNTVKVFIIKYGARLLLRVFSIGKNKLKLVEDYLDRVESIHRDVKIRIEDGELFTEELKNPLYRYEIENVEKLWQATYEGSKTGKIKQEMVSQYCEIETGLHGKIVNIVIELLLLVKGV